MALLVGIALRAAAEPPRQTAPIRQISDSLGTGPTLTDPNAYNELAAQGYRSILSVDGRPCDVKAAQAAGLTVAHVPVGYDAFDEDELAHLARAWADLPHPLYVHCHHGRLRGPAVAALFLRWNGASQREAENVLAQSDFDPRYEALRSSIDCERPSPSPVPLVASSAVRPLTRAMLSLEDALASLAKEPSDEAVLLWDEAMTETERASTTDPNWDTDQWGTALEVFRATPHDVKAIRQQCAVCHAINKSR